MERERGRGRERGRRGKREDDDEGRLLRGSVMSTRWKRRVLFFFAKAFYRGGKRMEAAELCELIVKKERKEIVFMVGQKKIFLFGKTNLEILEIKYILIVHNI